MAVIMIMAINMLNIIIVGLSKKKMKVHNGGGGCFRRLEEVTRTQCRECMQVCVIGVNGAYGVMALILRLLVELMLMALVEDPIFFCLFLYTYR